MSSRDNMINAAKERAKMIDNYIKNNRLCNTKKRHSVFQSNKIERINVYELPRRLVRLNPNNGRFKAELDIIQQDRKQENKAIELDPNNAEDSKTLQDMNQGKYPPSSERQRAYKNLLENIKEVAQKTGGNGQEAPGLITHDGILINGNRRWVVMEELADANKKKKHAAEPLKYDTIEVARLKKDVDKYTLWKNEAKEQISQDSREEYDYVNSALEIKRGFELLKDQGMSDKKARTEIAKAMYGRTEKDIVAYLDFLDITDLFLESVDRKGQYTFVQELGDDKGIVTILQELAKERKKHQREGMGLDEMELWINSAFAFCLFSKEKPKISQDGRSRRLSFGHREYRQFQKKVLESPDIRTKFPNSSIVKEIDLTNPSPNDVTEFYQRMRESQEEYDINEDIITPVSLLKKAQVSLSKVSKDLSGSRKEDKVKQIKGDGGLEYLEDIDRSIVEIKKKIK